MLYEVAVIQKPTKKEQEEGKVEKLVMAPNPLCAGSPQAAVIIAAKELDTTDLNPDLLEVLVRPFVKQ